MKLKVSLLIALLFIVLISLSVVYAEENTTQTLADDNNNSNDVDLEVSVSVNDHADTVDCSWTVTVTSLNGTAENAQVQNQIPSNMRIVYYTLDCGTFDPNTKIWTVGDLTPNNPKSLILFGKFNSPIDYDSICPFTVNAIATTDSHENDLSNNAKSITYKNDDFWHPTSSYTGGGMGTGFSDLRSRLNIGSYLPTFKYNNYRAPPKKVSAVTVKKTTTKTVTKTVKKTKKKTVKKIKKKTKKTKKKK